MPRTEREPNRTAGAAARRGDGYVVELPGRLSPSLLRSLERAGAARGAQVHSLVESVFVLSEFDGDVPEVAARLQDRGLVVLGIRRLDSDRSPAAPPTREDRR